MEITIFPNVRTDVSIFGSYNIKGNSKNIFNYSNLNNNFIPETEWKNKSLVVFGELINNRKEYLTSLPSLNKNWISGNSHLPNNEVIDISKKILDDFIRFLNKKKAEQISFQIPKLIMGPIPSGGIGMEFHINPENALYINIHNSLDVEIEIKYYDYYSTIISSNASKGLITSYEHFIDHRGNTGWRNPLSVL